MKTRIRDSYTPKLGDYCNTLVIDKETGNQYLFDADGVWTLISTDEEGIVAEAVAQANAYTDDVAEGKVDKEEGKGLSENDFTDEDKEKLDDIEDGAQENVIEVIKRNGTALPVTDKTVDIAVPTTTSSLTNDSGYITNEVGDLVNYYDKDETDTLIATEAETRDAADLNLQEQIDAISSSSDVVDVVGTYAELQAYDTSKLGDNDIIKVLTDETHDDAISYYRWNDTTETFSYIGSQGPFYTKSETDATFVPQTRTINGKGLNSDIVLTAADVNALPASTVIPTVNDATLTIKKNGTTVTTFTANSAQNATADISVPTKVSDLTNDLDFVEETDLADVAFSGDYADLTGTPSIPTKTSDLTNDSDFVSDANYVHTDNNFTTALKNKLNGIAAGAEVNVQSDWNVTDTTSDAFIKNKPSIPTKTSDLTNDSGFITSAALPTKTSDLTNDSGFITKNASDLTNYYTETEINSMFNALPAVPTKTSDLTNDSGFLTTSTLPIATASRLGVVKIGSGINVAADGTISAAVASLDWANITNKPTDVSYWTNDAGYITSAALPTKTSDLTNDSGFITSAALPTKTSDLTNDSGFITSSVNNLTNYYKKSETYTQGEVNSLLSAIVIPTKTSDLTNDGADGTSTYVEADDLATVATSGSYADLSNKPTIGNATLTIQRNGTNVQTFTANATSNKTANITVPTKTSDLTNDSNFVSDTDYATASTGGVVKVGSGLEITNGVLSATGGGTADAVEWDNVLNKPTFSTVATSGSYNDLTDKPTIPTVNNATLTIQRNSTNVGTFTANASSNKTINITVPTTAADVSALPASTKYGASITVSLNTTDYKMTTTLKDQDGNTLGTAQTIDLPLESVVVNGSYDSTNKKIVLTLQNGNTIDIPVGDLIAGLQAEITSTNKLSSDLVDDTNHTHKFVTAAQITKLNGIAAGAEVNQNAFSNVKVGTTTVAADAKTDTLELVAGSNVTITPDATNDKVTIAATNTTYDDATTTAHGLMTAADKVKLNGIATGAEVNVQSDWSVTDSSSDAFIKNKPTIPTVNNGTLTIQKNGTSVATFTANQSGNSTANITVPTKTSDLTNDSDFVEDANYVHTDNNYTTTEKNKLAGIAAGAEVNVQANWAQTTTTADDYIKNKPTIPTVNNATLTITQNGTSVGTFTANASSNKTIALTDTTYSAGTNIDITSNTIKTKTLGVEYIMGTQSASTNVWTGVSTDTGCSSSTIYTGKVIVYHLPYAGTSTAATLNLTLPDGTTTGAKNVKYNTGGNVTTHYGAGCDIFLVFDGTYWKAAPWYDSNNYDRIRHNNVVKAAAAITSGRICVGNSNGYKIAANAITSDISYPILWAGSNVDAAATNNNFYNAYPSVNLTSTKSGWSGTANKMVFLVGTLSGTTFTVNSDVFTQTVPSSADNKVYTPIGLAYSTTQIYFFPTNTYWEYRNGAFRPISSCPTLATVATSGSYNDLSNKPTIPTVGNATLTIQKNGTNVQTFTANATSNKTANITVPTTVAELSDASTYVTQNSLATQLANKQDVLTAGDHINITGSTIKAVDYVHSEDPVSTSAVTPVVTGNMISNGTITADKLATDATLKLTLSTSDIGEGAALAANTLYGVYQ